MSTTDPDARVMKMPDGGFRPAVHVPLTDAARAIVGVIAGLRSRAARRTVPKL